MLYKEEYFTILISNYQLLNTNDGIFEWFVWCYSPKQLTWVIRLYWEVHSNANTYYYQKINWKEFKIINSSKELVLKFQNMNEI